LIGHYECQASLFGKAPKFRRTMQRTGVSHLRAIGIGDETRDIEPARKAGIVSGAVTWGYATPRALERAAPTVLFQTPDDVVDHIAPR